MSVVRSAPVYRRMLVCGGWNVVAITDEFKVILKALLLHSVYLFGLIHGGRGNEWVPGGGRGEKVELVKISKIVEFINQIKLFFLLLLRCLCIVLYHLSLLLAFNNSWIRT